MKKSFLLFFVLCFVTFLSLGCGNETKDTKQNSKDTNAITTDKSDSKQVKINKETKINLPQVNIDTTILIGDHIGKAIGICGNPSKKMPYNSKNLNAYNIKFNPNKVVENPDTIDYEFTNHNIWIVTTMDGTIRKIGWMDNTNYPSVKFGGRRAIGFNEMAFISSDFNEEQIIQSYGKPLRRAYGGSVRYSDNVNGTGNVVLLVYNNANVYLKDGKLSMVLPGAGYFKIENDGILIRKAPSSNSSVIRALNRNEYVFETGYIRDTGFHEIVLENGEGPYYVKRGTLPKAQFKDFYSYWEPSTGVTNSKTHPTPNVNATTNNTTLSCRITGSDVNMRLGPGKQYDVIGVFNKGELVTELDHEMSKNTSWAKVRRSNGTVGWVSRDYCEQISVSSNNNQGYSKSIGDFTSSDKTKGTLVDHLDSQNIDFYVMNESIHSEMTSHVKHFTVVVKQVQNGKIIKSGKWTFYRFFAEGSWRYSSPEMQDNMDILYEKNKIFEYCMKQLGWTYEIKNKYYK